VIALDAATVLLQWAVGGLAFLWVTTRHRVVGLGYGWLMRGTFGLMAMGAVWVGWGDAGVVRTVATVGVVIATGAALAVSIARKGAGVAGQKALAERRSARVAAMTGIDRDARGKADEAGPEFPPRLDLIAPAVGVVALVAAGIDAGDPALLSVVRVLLGAALYGAVSDAMLLGHWYLVQPGLARAPIIELVRWTAAVWPFHLAAFLWPTGMVSVLNGTIDDGYNGLLGWFWVACVVTTIGLVAVTRLALKERQYAAVMAATGLLYLAILTAFGQDLVARAALAP
jgi:hypothetical protein